MEPYFVNRDIIPASDITRNVTGPPLLPSNSIGISRTWRLAPPKYQDNKKALVDEIIPINNQIIIVCNTILHSFMVMVVGLEPTQSD